MSNIPMSPEHQIIAAIRRIIRAVDLHSRRLREHYGLTGPQLAVLQEAGLLGEVSVGAIARAVHLSQATVTGILDRLEQQGSVKRRRSGEDRRNVIVEITEVGRNVLKSAPSLLQDRFSRELSKLEEWERTSILATLQRIATMMDAEELPSSPMLATDSLTTTTPVMSGSVIVEDIQRPAPKSKQQNRLKDQDRVQDTHTNSGKSIKEQT